MARRTLCDATLPPPPPPSSDAPPLRLGQFIEPATRILHDAIYIRRTQPAGSGTLIPKGGVPAGGDMTCPSALGTRSKSRHRREMLRGRGQAAMSLARHVAGIGRHGASLDGKEGKGGGGNMTTVRALLIATGRGEENTTEEDAQLLSLHTKKKGGGVKLPAKKSLLLCYACSRLFSPFRRR